MVDILTMAIKRNTIHGANEAQMAYIVMIADEPMGAAIVFNRLINPRSDPVVRII